MPTDWHVTSTAYLGAPSAISSEVLRWLPANSVLEPRVHMKRLVLCGVDREK